jgi:hypothetical protein
MPAARRLRKRPIEQETECDRAEPRTHR